MHIRQAITERFESILVEEFGETRVSRSSKPATPTLAGTFRVDIPEEAIETRDYDPGSPRFYDRAANVNVIIGVANPEQTDRFRMDDLSKSVEHLIASQGEDLGDLVNDVELVKFAQEQDDGTRQVHIGILTFLVTYTTLSTDVTQNTF